VTDCRTLSRRRIRDGDWVQFLFDPSGQLFVPTFSELSDDKGKNVRECYPDQCCQDSSSVPDGMDSKQDRVVKEVEGE